MRLVVDSLIAMMLVALLAAVLWHHRIQERQVLTVQHVHHALSRLQEQVLYHGAVGDVPTSVSGFPLEVSPLWFDSSLPTNTMVPGRHPWVDVAPDGDLADQPPDPVITRSDQAGFWYNPNRGIFRARVQPQLSDKETLAVYNQVNNTTLKSLPRSASSARQPRPLKLMAQPVVAPAKLAAPDHTATLAPAGAGDSRPAAEPRRIGKRPTLLDAQ